jgi:pimeloyl-ACP methyl ester carboxylesterase
MSRPLYTDCAIIFDAMARVKKPTLQHSALVPVPGYQASKARWALQPRGQAVLFVHGFNGTSVGTWKGFDEILPLEPRARGLDLLFYGYDTWLTDIRSSGRKLFKLMQTLHTDNGSLASPALGTARTSFNGYKSILVCAHSLGGVVTRWALLHACKRDEPWAENTASILFAPAHLAISDRMLVKLAAKLSIPVVEMLERFELDLLHEQTGAAQRQRISNLLTPKAVVQAEMEKWVMGGYDKDPGCIFVRGATHQSICKPTYTFMLPIELVLSQLAALPGGIP